MVRLCSADLNQRNEKQLYLIRSDSTLIQVKRRLVTPVACGGFSADRIPHVGELTTISNKMTTLS